MVTIEEELKSKFKSEQQKAIINLTFTGNWVDNQHNNYMSKFDLSMAQFNILRILRGAKDYLNVRTVKERMIEKSPNTTRLMDKLLDKNFIERKRCEEDRRVVFIRISEKGLNLLSEIDKTFDVDFLNGNNLTEEEARQLNYLLDKIRD